MAGSLKIWLAYICFPTFFQLPKKCHICAAVLENLFIEFTTYYYTKEVLKGLAMIFAGQENPFIIFKSKDIYIYFKKNNEIPINSLEWWRKQGFW